MYSYTWLQWILFFYIYCFLGWLWESCYVSVKKKHWVNRGFLHLPLLPIYGSGAIVVLFVSLPLRGNLLLVYLAGMVAATLLELVVGLVMEALFKVKYWDYSNQPFNYKGVICLSSSLFWGVLTIFLTEVAQKPLERLVFRLSPAALAGLVAIISAAFLYDTVISVKAALDLARVLTAIEKAREEMAEELREMEERAAARMNEAKENWADRLGETRENLADRLDEAYESLSSRLNEAQESLAGRLDEAQENLSSRLDEARESMAERRQEWENRREATKEVWDEKKSRLPGMWASAAEKQAQSQEDYQRKMDEFRAASQQKLDELLEKAYRVSKGAARRNPGMSSERFKESIRRLQERTREKRR